jgi:hypothetical protein
MAVKASDVTCMCTVYTSWFCKRSDCMRALAAPCKTTAVQIGNVQGTLNPFCNGYCVNKISKSINQSLKCGTKWTLESASLWTVSMTKFQN